MITQIILCLGIVFGVILIVILLMMRKRMIDLENVVGNHDGRLVKTERQLGGILRHAKTADELVDEIKGILPKGTQYYIWPNGDQE